MPGMTARKRVNRVMRERLAARRRQVAWQPFAYNAPTERGLLLGGNRPRRQVGMLMAAMLAAFGR
jgi:hypothetical protein